MRFDLHLWMAPLVAAFVAASAHASTIAVIPAATQVAAGSQLEVLISGSGFPDGADGGDFELFWDDEVLSFQSILIVDPPWDLSFVDDSRADSGNLDAVDVFSSLETPGAGGAAFEIARILFTVIGQPGNTTELFLGIDEVGWSLAGESIATDYVSSEVTVTEVPEPVTGSLLLLGLAAIAGLRPRRPSSSRR